MKCKKIKCKILILIGPKLRGAYTLNKNIIRNLLYLAIILDFSLSCNNVKYNSGNNNVVKTNIYHTRNSTFKKLDFFSTISDSIFFFQPIAYLDGRKLDYEYKNVSNFNYYSLNYSKTQFNYNYRLIDDVLYDGKINGNEILSFYRPLFKKNEFQKRHIDTTNLVGFSEMKPTGVCLYHMDSIDVIVFFVEDPTPMGSGSARTSNYFFSICYQYKYAGYKIVSDFYIFDSNFDLKKLIGINRINKKLVYRYCSSVKNDQIILNYGYCYLN